MNGEHEHDNQLIYSLHLSNKIKKNLNHLFIIKQN